MFGSPGSTHAAGWIEVTFQVIIDQFSSTNGALRAVKGTEEGDESHVDLTQHCVKSIDTLSVVLHHVWLTWKYRRRWLNLCYISGDY